MRNSKYNLVPYEVIERAITGDTAALLAVQERNKAYIGRLSGGNTDMMRKGIRILCAVCLIFSAAILTTDAIRTSVTGAETNVSPTQQTEQAPYMLGEYQGRIASYRTGSTEPMEVFDVYLDSQPSTSKNCCMGFPRRRYRSYNG